jgi:hypothetical protein
MLPSQYEVLIFINQTPNISEEDAVDRTRKIVNRALDAEIEYFFRITNAYELNALAIKDIHILTKLTSISRIPFITAHPAAGLTTKDGIPQKPHSSEESVAIEKTQHPPSTADFIASHSELNFTSMSLDDENLENILESPPEGMMFFDISSEVELYYIGKMVMRNKLVNVCAGSKAFAVTVAELLFLTKRRISCQEPNKPTLIINRSSPIEPDIQDSNDVGISSQELPPNTEAFQTNKAASLLSPRLTTKLQSPYVIVQPQYHLKSSQQNEQDVISEQPIQESLAKTARPLLESGKFGFCVLPDPKDMFPVLHVLGIETIYPAGEIPGGYAFLQTTGTVKEVVFVMKIR